MIYIDGLLVNQFLKNQIHLIILFRYFIKIIRVFRNFQRKRVLDVKANNIVHIKMGFVLVLALFEFEFESSEFELLLLLLLLLLEKETRRVDDNDDDDLLLLLLRGRRKDTAVVGKVLE